MLDQFEDHMTHTVIPCDFLFFFFQGNFFPLKTRFPFQRSRQGGRPCLHMHSVILFVRLASTIFLGMEVSQGMNVTRPELLGVHAASFCQKQLHWSPASPLIQQQFVPTDCAA